MAEAQSNHAGPRAVQCAGSATGGPEPCPTLRARRRRTGILGPMRPLALLLVPLLAPLFTGACSPAEERAPDSGSAPVLVLAVDGFEWNVILPLLRAGEMPHLEELMERGTFGQLSTMMPNKSPRLWTTIATGKPPSEHGILDFLKPTEEPGSGAQHFTSRDRRTKAFWNVLSDAGVSNDTIGWWVTYPVEEVLGTMVAQTNTTQSYGIKKGHLEAGLPHQVWPPEFEARVFAALGESHDSVEARMEEIFGTRPEDLRPRLKKLWKQCEWTFRADSTYAAVLRARLAEGPPARVTSIFMGGTDVVGHRFWPAFEPETADPRPDPEEVAAFRHVIPAYYRYADKVIGELTSLYPADTTVIVIADHGMRAGGHGGEDAGVFLAAGPGIRDAPPFDPQTLDKATLPMLGRLADFCPTLLSLVDVPFGEDMLGRPIEALFTPEFQTAHPARSVPTHDDAEWLSTRGEEFEFEDAERVEQLRELGYLGDE